MDLYAQELKVWKECAAFRKVLDHAAEQGAEALAAGSESVEAPSSCKMPGTFEW